MRMLLEVGLSNAVMAGLLALVAAILSHICRRPALAHRLWLLVLVKLATPPILWVPVPWPPPSEPAETAGLPSSPVELPVRPGAGQPVLAPAAKEGLLPAQPAGGGGEGPSPLASGKEPVHWSEGPVPEANPPTWAQTSWEALFALLWLTGSLLWFAWTAVRVRRFRRLLRHVRRAPDELQEQARRLAARLGLRRCPEVWLVPGAVSPLVWAVGQAPCVLFPARLLELLDNEQRAALLTHELAHVRRRDHWVRLLELVVTGLYWWHPVVWWARREMHEAEEQCCDAWVVWALEGAHGAYARALLQTAAFVVQARPAVPVAASGVGPVVHLKRRLTMIMQGRTAPSLSWAGSLAVFGLGVLVLPLLPAWSQQPIKDPTSQGPAARDARDQQIEALRAAIKVLEAQKHAEAEKKSEGESKERLHRAALEKARAEAAALAKQIDVKRAELHALEARYKEASDLLARLQGSTPEGLRLQWVVKPTPIQTPSITSGDREIRVADPVRRVETGWVFTAPAAPPADSKSAELEQKLNRVLKEVEDLRREIRRQHPQPGTIPVNPYAPLGSKPTTQQTTPENPLIRWGFAVPPQPKKPDPKGSPELQKR